MENELGLVNMNARLYDPVLGRFISADTIVPEPGNMQAFNRYAYVLGGLQFQVQHPMRGCCMSRKYHHSAIPTATRLWPKAIEPVHIRWPRSQPALGCIT